MELKENKTKDLECVHCLKFFDCDGKPEGVNRCIKFEWREEIKPKAGGENA